MHSAYETYMPCQYGNSGHQIWYIDPLCAICFPICLPDDPVGSYVMSLPDTASVKSLALEGTFSTVRDDHISEALVTNTTGTSFTLKSGVLLDIFEVCNDLSFKNPTHLAASVSSHDNTYNVHYSISEFNYLIKVLDYPRAKPILIFWQSIEKLLPYQAKNLVSLTVKHLIVLQTNA